LNQAQSIDVDIDCVGFDPTIKKFAGFYDKDILAVPEFFTKESFREQVPQGHADIVTSIAMFYDLPDPCRFADDVYEVLADDGIWHCEVAYYPAMATRGAFDGVCHEHLEYYGLHQLWQLASAVGFVITDVEFNDINGGSVAVTMAKKSSGLKEWTGLDTLIQMELGSEEYLDGMLAERATMLKQELPKLLAEYKARGLNVHGLGASTKGNVVLQWCGIGPDLLPCIQEVNADKFGKMTPGSRIPIVAEGSSKPGAFLVLPWHFRESFLNRRECGDPELIFPLPVLEVIE
jgi:hypothetical protein